MTRIAVYSDYVCPFCLLAEQVVSEAIGDRDIPIQWRAFELRPDPVPTLKPEDPYLPAIWRNSVYSLADRLGVPVKLPSISPQPRTAKAFELLALAQDKGLDHAYSMRVLRAFFQEDRDIGDPDVLVELAADAGLDRGEARQALEHGTYAERHQEALRHAREDMEITSVPTIVVGDRVFRGTPPIEELKAAIDRLETGAGDDGRSNPDNTGE
ncbi:DsbA family oxidoreductase [Aureimonas altamirensis]|uniref:DsbA family oxidoreductase n=1 Tax=Aureimonas altamirensis TaxID=370622 RepID=UPI002036D5E0|nr:DsbA family oxidoreductase [Aureimonas altamirensis]MCM2506048.1 DsbA family oxidoreductase [Aureimonas altamirensis]